MNGTTSERQFALPGVLVWGALWLVVVAVAQYARPLMPIDETRYLAVAWEMWQRGDFLVPHLNGLPYSQKPPLMFWLIDAGWAVFGVHSWWARLVAPTFGLGCLALTAVLARRLWPDSRGIGRLGPVLLMGSLFWAVFTTLTMFDTILAFFALVGLLGIVIARQGRLRLGFAILGVAIGLGVLTKGPVILVHVLPVALLAPWWARRPAADPEAAPPPSTKAWYGGLGLAVVGGAVIGLAWALPAAAFGGHAYAQSILWGQSAGRVVDAFAHSRPWWWYVPVLPAMALPWLVWPPLWRAALGTRRKKMNGGVRFCLAWAVPAFVIFSAISGKQPHYLLPELPALALLAAAALTADDPAAGTRPRDWLPPAVLLGVIAVGLAVVRWLPLKSTALTSLVQPAWALLAFAAVAALWLARRWQPRLAVLAIAGTTVLAVVAGHMALRPALMANYDLTAVADQLGAWQRAGHPLAHVGKYHGQFQFLGRLEAPITVIRAADAPAWVAEHPDGMIITYTNRPSDSFKAELVAPFRGKWVAVWSAAAAAADPTLVDRP